MCQSFVLGQVSLLKAPIQFLTRSYDLISDICYRSDLNLTSASDRVLNEIRNPAFAISIRLSLLLPSVPKPDTGCLFSLPFCAEARSTVTQAHFLTWSYDWVEYPTRSGGMHCHTFRQRLTEMWMCMTVTAGWHSTTDWQILALMQ